MCLFADSEGGGALAIILVLLALWYVTGYIDDIEAARKLKMQERARLDAEQEFRDGQINKSRAARRPEDS